MLFKKTKLDGVYSKRRANGTTSYFFDDGMVFAYVDVDTNGNYVNGTFKEDSKPNQQLMVLVAKQRAEQA